MYTSGLDTKHVSELLLASGPCCMVTFPHIGPVAIEPHGCCTRNFLFHVRLFSSYLGKSDKRDQEYAAKQNVYSLSHWWVQQSLGKSTLYLKHKLVFCVWELKFNPWRDFVGEGVLFLGSVSLPSPHHAACRAQLPGWADTILHPKQPRCIPTALIKQVPLPCGVLTAKSLLMDGAYMASKSPVGLIAATVPSPTHRSLVNETRWGQCRVNHCSVSFFCAGIALSQQDVIGWIDYFFFVLLSRLKRKATAGNFQFSGPPCYNTLPANVAKASGGGACFIEVSVRAADRHGSIAASSINLAAQAGWKCLC